MNHLPTSPARRRAGATLAGLAMAPTLGVLAPRARAGEQADRAVSAVRQLVASGQVKPGTVLRLRAKQGNLVSLLGRDFQLQREWEQLTGTAIDATVMPQLDSMAFIRDGQEVDLTIARTHEFPDLLAAGLIEDLTPWLARFGMTLSADAQQGYLLPAKQSQVGNRVVAVPADLDIAMLFIRRDLLEDPRHRAEFRQRHGRDLAAPRTWDEYLELARFFTRPADGLFGAAEPRERRTGWMYWLPRYLSAAGDRPWLFDEQMRPLIAGSAGVAATANFAATVACSPPQVLEDGKDFSYTLPQFVRGHAFSTILTAATAKIASREDSAVRGRFVAAPMPGSLVGGRLVRRTTFIYGNNLVVPRSAQHKAVALMYAMWLTDPINSLRSVSANGIADPYRQHHLRDEAVRQAYTAQAMDVLRDEIGHVSPGGTGLPGNTEYLGALSHQLWQVAAGRASPAEALRRTAREWDAITDRLGRPAQIAAWKQQRAELTR